MSSKILAGLKFDILSTGMCPDDNHGLNKTVTVSVGDIVRGLKYREGSEEKTISGRVKDIIVVDTKPETTVDTINKNNNNSTNGGVATCPYYPSTAAPGWVTTNECDWATTGTTNITQDTNTDIQLYGSGTSDNAYGITLTTSDPVVNDCVLRDYYTTEAAGAISYPRANPLNVNKEGIYPDLPHLVSSNITLTASGAELSINSLFTDRYVPKYLVIDASTEFNCNIVKVDIKYVLDIDEIDHSSCGCC